VVTWPQSGTIRYLQNQQQECRFFGLDGTWRGPNSIFSCQRVVNKNRHSCLGLPVFQMCCVYLVPLLLRLQYFHCAIYVDLNLYAVPYYL
jgi:hypothetical protein